MSEHPKSWFSQVVVENYSLFYAIAFRILRIKEEAEEAAHDAILKAYQRLDSLHDREQLIGWLARIVRNAAIDRKRKGGKTKVVAREVPETESPERPYRSAVVKELAGRVFEEIDKLPLNQQTVLTLRFMEELSIGDIARRLGVSENATRVRLHRALERLRHNRALQRAWGLEGQA